MARTTWPEAADDSLRRAHPAGTAHVNPDRVFEGEVEILAVHGAARRVLAAEGQEDLARGAANVGTVAALTLASVRSATAKAFGTKVVALRRLVADVEPQRRAHVAALIDAALEAETAARLATGLRPHDHRFTGWMSDVAPVVDDGTDGAAPAAVEVPPDAVTLYAAASHADDVDLVLQRTILVMRPMSIAARRGESTEGHLDAVQADAFALCVRPASSPAAAEDARRTLIILAKTLRRRRPSAAAVLRAKLDLDRMTRRRGK